MSDFIGNISFGQLRVAEYKDGVDIIVGTTGVTLTQEQAHELGKWLQGEDE